MKRALKYVLGILAGTMTLGMSAFAAEVTVTPVDLVLYSNETAVLYEEPDLTSTVVLDAASFPDDLAIQVTGITSTGFYEVNVGGTYYVPEAGLTDVGITAETTETTSTSSDVVVDLGYGITLTYPEIITCESTGGTYYGSISIVGAKILSKSSVVGYRISLKFIPLDYAYKNGKMYIHQTSLDSEGYEVDDGAFSANEATDPIGEVITETFYTPLTTSVITIEG